MKKQSTIYRHSRPMLTQRQLTLEDVITLLSRSCGEAGSQGAFAEANAISPQYITDVLKRKREPGPKILDALGLRKVVVYVKQEE